MDQYKRLASNTLLFAISTFSSKLLFFIVKPLFSYWFDTPEIAGVTSLLVNCSNFLIPLVSLGISNAIIRFGLEKGIDRRNLYTNGTLCIGAGFAGILLLFPLFRLWTDALPYLPFIYIYVLVSCLRTLNCQFVRAKQLTRLYAFDGILSTVVTIGFYILFLRVLNLGAVGYMLAVICADGFSTIFLFIVARLWQYLRFKRINWALLTRMLRYALPLVPASIFWWVTNASDRFFVAAMMENGTRWTGIYDQSYVLPSLLTVVSTIFTEAWQISAFTDGAKDHAGRAKFFSRVFSAYQSVMFLAAAGIMLLCQPIMRIWRADYFIAWEFIPMLTLATVFSSFCNYLNSIYMVEKRSGLSLATMTLGAVLNCVLNFLLIPPMGVMGAAFATFASYFLVFAVRVASTRKLLPIRFRFLRMSVNLAALVLQCLLMQFDVPLWPIWCTLLCGFIALLNLQNLLETAKQFLFRRGKKDP